MELKVKEIGFKEEKSAQEIEQELLNKHEESMNADDKAADDAATAAAAAAVDDGSGASEEDELLQKEKEVLSYIGSRYNKEINSLDELFNQREQNEDLPEDVASFLKYKKETGRGIQDFLKLQQDFDSMDENTLLREYFTET